jgi:predicted RNase H-like nuclease/catechol 2,3-dioxygenase-like lactoylglutathione lyase family enzyme
MFVGVDGCKAGWFSVTLHSGGGHHLNLYPHIAALWENLKEAEVLLIDIPIGLAETGVRACDLMARQVLRQRGSSIFNAPVRAAVYASTYAEASEINRQITGSKLSKQIWNITPRIREVDALLRYDEHARSVIREAHPEVQFWSLNSSAMTQNKKTRGGIQERLDVLERFLPDAGQIYENAVEMFPRHSLGFDDILDALVLAIAAGMGELTSLPPEPPRDERGLPMRIVYARTPHIVRLHHVQITIPTGAENDARAFYCDLLGLREIDKPESLAGRGGLWLELGDLEIHIGVEDGMDRTLTKAHLAYQVGDIQHWRKRMDEAGIPIGDSVPIPGFERFEIRDPFGNRVEFIQPASARVTRTMPRITLPLRK